VRTILAKEESARNDKLFITNTAGGGSGTNVNPGGGSGMYGSSPIGSHSGSGSKAAQQRKSSSKGVLRGGVNFREKNTVSRIKNKEKEVHDSIHLQASGASLKNSRTHLEIDENPEARRTTFQKIQYLQPSQEPKEFENIHIMATKMAANGNKLIPFPFYLEFILC
jgi:hypothetical protein